MLPKAKNRFALFTDPHDDEPAPVQQPPEKDNPFVNQVADENVPWKEVGRGGTTKLPVKTPVKTITIRNTDRKIPAISASTQSRKSSGAPSPGSEAPRKPVGRENWCGVCSQFFGSKSSLQSHIKSLAATHGNYCNLCRRVFVDRNGLRNHVDNSAGHDVYCNLCLSAFQNRWGLQNHFENNYAVGHQFACLACLMGFTTNKALEHHLLTGEKHVWCTTCHRRFRNQDERDAHWTVTTKHKHCLQPACDFDAPNEATLKKHLEEDHFHCTGCKRIFASRTRLNNHTKECKFDIPCPNDCGTVCAGQSMLIEHLTCCFYCMECGHRTDSEDKYQLHLAKHTEITTDQPTLPCWACTSVRFATPVELVEHLEICPNLPSKILLTTLGKWWYSPLYMDLDMHAQIRREEINLDTMANWMDEGILQPFVCRADSCGRASFSKLSDLVAHVQEDGCEWDVDKLRLDALKTELLRYNGQ
ncbi:unnamed protein product [Periconia digitata]|uniref:C2H2-type domain-containing protein n=1 Tax=Periconia digitata TaxID=1303443 RepID=A0A9W4UBG0_9PLEO|nr:unnamed protein product [Periconia digitata]